MRSDREHTLRMDVPATADIDPVLLDAMRLLAEQPRLSQRQLSKQLGLSLGKTNYLLRALLDKGFVKVRNFRRSDNKLAYAYLLTGRGLREKLRLTHAFLVHKEAEFQRLQLTIAQLRQELAVNRPAPRAQGEDE